MEGFFNNVAPVETEVVVAQGKKKKRKLEKKEDEKDEERETKEKARLYCSCSEQWVVISKYSAQKLKEWVELKEFDNQKKLNETIFSFVHSAIAYAFDLVLRGESFIKQEIENDVSLRHSLEIEAGNWATLLSNKLKIGCLLSVDSANGKMRQRQENKSQCIITEVEENGHHFARGAREEEEEDHSAIPGDPSDPIDNDSMREEGLGQNDQLGEPAL